MGYDGWLQLRQPVFTWNLPLPLPAEASEYDWFVIVQGRFEIHGDALLNSVVEVQHAILSRNYTAMPGSLLLQGNLAPQGLTSLSQEVVTSYKNYTNHHRHDPAVGSIVDCNYEDLVLHDVSVLLWVYYGHGGLIQMVPTRYSV